MTPDPDWLNAKLNALEQAGLKRRRRVVRALPGGRCLVDGRQLVNFASNDYLGLAADGRLAESARRALAESGAGAAASAAVCGRTPWHVALERSLAAFEQQPDAVLFPTGYAANVGTIMALVGPEDTVYCDRHNHASLVDGCRLSRARLRVYRHNELDALERDLARNTDTGARWIVTDGVFSMEGDLAPLPDLCSLAARFAARVIVDEAHGTGVWGAHGRGVTEELGVENQVAVRIGTLSKAAGSLGGFVAGPVALCDWLFQKARPQMYSTALPPAICAAAATAVEMIEGEPWRRERLHRLSALFRDQLALQGLEAASSGRGPIIPVLVDTAASAVDAAAGLEAAGFLVAAIRPPTVASGTSRLRICISASHEDDDVVGFARALASALRPAGCAQPT
jgi:8-amino-7-oxononanoate synthase